MTKPTLEMVSNYCILRRNSVDPEHFVDYYEANGWKVGRNAMKNWQAAVRLWERNQFTQPAVWRDGNGSIPSKAKQRAFDNGRAVVEALFGKNVNTDGSIDGQGVDLRGSKIMGAIAGGTNRGGD